MPFVLLEDREYLKKSFEKKEKSMTQRVNKMTSILPRKAFFYLLVFSGVTLVMCQSYLSI